RLRARILYRKNNLIDLVDEVQPLSDTHLRKPQPSAFTDAQPALARFHEFPACAAPPPRATLCARDDRRGARPEGCTQHELGTARGTGPLLRAHAERLGPARPRLHRRRRPGRVGRGRGRPTERRAQAASRSPTPSTTTAARRREPA